MYLMGKSYITISCLIRLRRGLPQLFLSASTIRTRLQGLRYVLRYRRGLRFLPSYLKVWRGGRLKRDTIRYVPIPEELAVWRKFSAQSGKLEPVSGGRNAFKRTDSKLWNTYDRTFKCHAHALIDIKPKS